MAGPNDHRTPALPNAISIATSRAVLRRSFVLALVIGAGLVLFNQRGAIFGAAAFSFPAVVTPFVVICISQALGVRAYVRERQVWHPEMFWTTVRSHGIPRRALSVAPFVGVAVTAIMAGLTWIEAGDPLAVPVAQVLQVFVLPFAFGLVSQAAAYRRAAASA